MKVEGKNGEDIEQGYIEAFEHYLREKLDEVEDEEVIEIAKKVNEHSGWEKDGEAIEVENVLPDTLRDHLSDYEAIKNKSYESKL